VLREANRTRLLASVQPRVFLHCNVQLLHDRINADPNTAANRPSLTHLGGGIDEIRSLLAIREPLYRSVLTHELDVTPLSVDEAARRLADIQSSA
jgi:shikimate kinase